jgi:hypothetical protein
MVSARCSRRSHSSWPQLNQLGPLRVRDAADRETLQQPLHTRDRRLEFVAGELQQLFHVFTLLLAALREQEQQHEAARQQQAQQRGLPNQHHVAAIVMLRDVEPACVDFRLRELGACGQQFALEHFVGAQLAAQQDRPPDDERCGREQRHAEHEELGAFREPLSESAAHHVLSLLASTSSSLSISAVV